jgi:glycosyltransferase involved in cell wall biosynthesis
MKASSGVSVVLGSFNRRRFLKLTVETVRDELLRADFPSEIIVIDGGSTDGTLSWLLKQKDIITIVQYNRGNWQGKPIERRSWGYFMNLGFKSAQGKYVCMLSDDCLVVPEAIINGYRHFEEELQKGNNVGAVAFYWRNWPEQKKYWVGLTFGNKMFVNHGMYLKEALDSVGYIDEDSYYFYHADGDLCLRMWQEGYVCLDSPNSYIEHYAHAAGKVDGKPDWERYCNKWEKLLGNQKFDWIEKEHTDHFQTVKLFKRRWLP